MIVVTAILGTEAPTSHAALVFENGYAIDITNDATARESAQTNINAGNVEEYRVGQSTWNALPISDWRL